MKKSILLVGPANGGKIRLANFLSVGKNRVVKGGHENIDKKIFFFQLVLPILKL
jgi:hypothetical protein